MFPVVLVLVIVGVLGVMASMADWGRWQRLAARYGQASRIRGDVFRWQSANFDGARYRGVLRVMPLPSGLYLDVMQPWSFRHPPLLIPWSDVEVLENRRGIPAVVMLSHDPPRHLFLGRAAGRALATLAPPVRRTRSEGI